MPKDLSKTTLVAIFSACALLLAVGYGATSYRSFLSLEGLLIVIGGSVANAFLSYQREDVLAAFATIRQMIRKPETKRGGLQRDIMQMIMWAHVLQAKDFIGLEKESARKISDPLLRYGMDLVITGYTSDKIRTMMTTVAEAEFERRTMPVTVLRNMAATAPAFGMVGTLIGMVTILNNVGTDMPSIGGGLAIAMLSTLYGILSARLVCLPAADKLLHKEEQDYFRYGMLREGLAMLAERQNPFYVQDRLNSFLEPSRQLTLSDYERMNLQKPITKNATPAKTLAKTFSFAA